MAQQSNYIVYDIETTGLKVGKHGICEIALLAINSVTLQEIGRYEAIIAPYKIFNPEMTELIDYVFDPVALKINGLTEEKIRAGKDAKEVACDMENFFKEFKVGRNKPVLAGHNIKEFDNPHLEAFFKVFKKDLWKLVSKHMIDTMNESKDIYPDMSGSGVHSLQGLCDRLGVDKFDAHSAMPDVIANTECLKHILKRKRGDGAIQVQSEEKDRPRDTFRF